MVMGKTPYCALAENRQLQKEPMAVSPPDFLKPRCEARPFDRSLICKIFFAKLAFGRSI
jgi:hypothetical protein